MGGSVGGDTPGDEDVIGASYVPRWPKGKIVRQSKMKRRLIVRFTNDSTPFNRLIDTVATDPWAISTIGPNEGWLYWQVTNPANGTDVGAFNLAHVTSWVLMPEGAVPWEHPDGLPDPLD